MTKLQERACEGAKRYLVAKGYEILETNWTCFAGAIDIIALDGDTLVFADVASRQGAEKGFPVEHKTEKKREKLEKIALNYLSDHDFHDKRVRFDSIALVVLGKQAVVRHHINALASAA